MLRPSVEQRSDSQALLIELLDLGLDARAGGLDVAERLDLGLQVFDRNDQLVVAEGAGFNAVDEVLGFEGGSGLLCSGP